MSIFVPNDTILINDKDSTWINSKIKRLIREKNFAEILQKAYQAK